MTAAGWPDASRHLEWNGGLLPISAHRVGPDMLGRTIDISSVPSGALEIWKVGAHSLILRADDGGTEWN